jgi:hypothetical protein
MPKDTYHLDPDEVLEPDQYLNSPNGRYALAYQSDGNLVLYKNYSNRDRRSVWASNTNGSPVSRLSMQGDGNLVIGPGWGPAPWASNTDGNPGSRLLVQDDGNVVIYRPDGTPIWATNTVLGPTGRLAQGDDMQPSEVLDLDTALTSANGKYTLRFQGDGNLVLATTSPDKYLWDRGTDGRQGETLVMQTDGNLVVYTLAGAPIWASNTAGNPGSQLLVQDDGNVVIYRPEPPSGQSAVWETATNQNRVPTGTPAQGDNMQPSQALTAEAAITSADGRFTFVFQTDGNLVLYKKHVGRNWTPLWASATAGQPGIVCLMQTDGNLVIYDGQARPLWASHTEGNPGSRIVMQNDGNVVIYRPDNTALWATNTQPLDYIHAYPNNRGDPDWNTCGQAAIGTMLDFYNVNPFPDLPRPDHDNRDQKDHWEKGQIIDRLKADGVGPDVIFGWGTTGGRIRDAMLKYGLTQAEVAWGGGVQSGYYRSNELWARLQEYLYAGRPVPVLVDIGLLSGAGSGFTAHWPVAYKIEDGCIYLGNGGGNSSPTFEEFRRAWSCIRLPDGFNFCAVFV